MLRGSDMEKSKRYFRHYFKEIQSTKNKMQEFITGTDAESTKFIEMRDMSTEDLGRIQKHWWHWWPD